MIKAIIIFLDYMNNYQSIEDLAKAHKISVKQAENLICEGEKALK